MLTTHHTKMTPYDADEIAERSLSREQTGVVETYVCATCGSSLDTYEKHPVVAESDTAVSVLLFCSSSCRRDWLETERKDG